MLLLLLFSSLVDVLPTLLLDSLVLLLLDVFLGVCPFDPSSLFFLVDECRFLISIAASLLIIVGSVGGTLEEDEDDDDDVDVVWSCGLGELGALDSLCADSGTLIFPSRVLLRGVAPAEMPVPLLSRLMGCGRIVCFSLYCGGSPRSI